MHNVGGMIGGDSPLSPRGEKYAAALPALILDNIGEAPLTVSRQLSHLKSRADASFFPGLDIYPPKNRVDRSLPALPEKDLEIAGRARCGCL